MSNEDKPNGKGSSPRPYSVDRELFELRYTLIWGTLEEKLEARMKLIEMGGIKDGGS